MHPYNLRPSLEWVSHPERRLSAHPFAAANLPTEYTFGEGEAIVDQGNLGSCTANMMDELIRYIMELQGVVSWDISRLWQYYQERVLEGTVSSDSGATIADTIKVAQQMGVFPETMYPYLIDRFASAPPSTLMLEASKHRLITSSMLQTDIVTTKTWIFNGGNKPLPIGYGFAVYAQYETVGADGTIAMPSGTTLGGHANSIWGWSDSRQAWRIHNVWGKSWGDQGRGWLPYNYVRWDNWGVAPIMQPTPPAPTPPPAPAPVSVNTITVNYITTDNHSVTKQVFP